MIEIDKNNLEELYINQQLTGREIGKILNVSPWIIWDRLKLFNIPIRKHVPSQKFPFSGNLNEKAYILGLRTGDLYATNKRKLVRIETSSSKLGLIEIFKNVFSKYGDVKVNERKGRITEKSFRTYIYLDSSFEFLVKKIEKMPEWVMNNNQNFFSFFAGYSDAEGSWIIANHKTKKGINKDSIFSLGSCDKEILQQIHQKLKELGFSSHLYLEKEKCTKTQLGEYSSDFYRIRIYGKDVGKLANMTLPFIQHERKNKQALEIIELEKIKLENLGTIGISCLYCNHKKVHKCSSYGYKGIRYKRYRCPICKKVFSEQTIKKFAKKGILCQQ